MQMQPVSSGTIEFITHDRRIQPLRVGRVYAQLMSSAGNRFELHHCAVTSRRHHLESSQRRLAMLMAHHLPRTIFKVHPQRECYLPGPGQ